MDPTDAAFVWQCKCGFIEHGDEMPEDCPKCLRVGQFDKVPEDMINEKVEEEVLSSRPEEDEDED
jgi:hypothetical protein